MVNTATRLKHILFNKMQCPIWDFDQGTTLHKHTHKNSDSTELRASPDVPEQRFTASFTLLYPCLGLFYICFRGIHDIWKLKINRFIFYNNISLQKSSSFHETKFI